MKREELGEMTPCGVSHCARAVLVTACSALLATWQQGARGPTVAAIDGCGGVMVDGAAAAQGPTGAAT